MNKDSWQLLKADNQDGLNQIYQRNIRLLLNYGLKIVADSNKVEDAIHDLFVYIWEKRHSVNCSIKEEHGYLCLSLKRDLIRKMNTKEVTFDISNWDAESDNIEKQMIDREINNTQTKRINNALNLLTSRQKEALHLKYNQGLDYDQISEAMNMNYQSCRNLIFRALSDLRSQLKSSIH